MNPFLLEYVASKYYQQEKQDDAKRMRLVKMIKHNPSKTPIGLARIYKSSMNQLGKRLVMLGTNMQIRAGVLSPVTLHSSDSDCQSELAC